MKSRLLFLLILLFPLWVWGQSVTGVSFDSEMPMVTQDFKITLSGYFPNGCFTGATITNYKTTNGQYLDLEVTYSRTNSEFCTQAIIPFSISKVIKINDSGSFEVRINGQVMDDPKYIEVHEETIITPSICTKAGAISCGQTITGSTSGESNVQSLYNCLVGYTWVGPEKVYSFSVSSTTTVTINMSITTSRLDLDLFLLGECYEGLVNCLAQSSADNTSSSQERITKTLTPGTYYIVVDGQYATSKGSFSLSLNCGSSGGGGGETGGSICSKASAISCGSTVSGSTTNETNYLSTYNCLQGYTLVGPEKVYKLSITQRTPVTINLTIASSGLDLDLFLLDDVCSSGTGTQVYSISSGDCVAESSSPNTSSRTETISKTLDPGTYYIVIDGQYSYSKGSFQLAVSCGNTGGNICEKASPISCGSSVSGSTSNETNYLTTYNCLQGYTLVGPEKVYKLTLTETTPVTIKLDISTSGLDLDLFLLSNVCGYATYDRAINISPGDCLAESSSPNTSSRSETITKTLNAGTYYIVIDGQYSYSKGSFQLSVSCGSTGDICDKAMPISCGSTVNGSTTNETNFLTTYSCLRGYTLVGPEKVYKLTLSEKTTVNIDLSILTSGLDLDLFLISNVCGRYETYSKVESADCLAESSTPNTSSNKETIVKTLEAGVYYIIVDGQYSYSKGNFQLKVDCSGGSICDKAMPISCGSDVSGSTLNETNFLTTYTCLEGYSLVGPEKVYKFTVTQRTPVTIQLAIQTSGLDLDLFLLSDVCARYGTYYKVEAPDCIGESSSPNTSSNLETITKTLDPGTYYIVVDGQYSYSKGSFRLSVNCCDQSPKQYNCGYITYKYTGSGGSLRYTFSSSQSIASGQSWLVNDRAISSATGNTFDYTFPSAGNYQVCFPYRNSAGCIEYCCYDIYVSNPFDCYDFDYRYNSSASAFQFTLNKPGANNVSWVVDDTGQSLGSGSTSNLLPLPGNCVERTITVRYYWNNRWYICCRKIWLCNPFDCYDFDYRFVSNIESSGYQFDLEKPGATNVSWVVDDTGSSLGTGATSNLLPIPGTCVRRTISVRYYWNGRWYICCRSIWLCNPLDCTPIVYRYVPNQGYQFSLTEPETSSQTWTIDETGQAIGSGTQSQYVRPPSNCVNYTISVRYFKNGIWYFCCLRIRICDPLSCNNIRYVTQNNGYQLTLDDTNAQQITWLDDDDNSRVLVSGPPTTVVPLPTPCRDRLISVRYYDPISRTWRYCCVLIKCGTPTPPTCTNDNCNLISYRYFESSGFQFTLTQAGASNISWSVLETGQQLGTGVSIGGLRPVTDCQVRTFMARYTLNGQEYVCCRKIWLCDPFNCNPIRYTYSDQGYQFTLDEPGASEQSWIIDETNEAIGSGPISTYVRPPSTGNCITRTISVRYYKNGTWYFCCQRIVICDPFSCQNIRYTQSGTNYNLNLEDNNANQIVWLDDNNNGLVLNQNVKAVSIPVPTPCIDRIISVRYYDPISRSWRYCCVRIPCGQAPCQLTVNPSTLQFTQIGGEQSVTVTSNATWVVNTPSENWIQATVVSGTSTMRVQVSPNNSAQTRSATLTLTCGGTLGKITVTQAAGSGGTGGGTPPWDEPQISSVSHTVAILRDVQSQIGNATLESGDYIGFFYKASNGNLVIAGKRKWEARNSLITVYGDDPSSPTQEGFKDGEVFNIKVWKASEGKEYDVVPEYLPLGTLIGNAIIDAQEKFRNQAVSGIGKLSAGTSGIVYDILLKRGWNLISSKATPSKPDMEEVFSPIVNDIELVKSISASYVPGFDNALGNWDIQQGYFVKAKKDVTLSIEGTKINPGAVSLPLRDGWQILPYFCDDNRPVGEIFADPTLGVTIVKSLTSTYVPGFSDDDAICMKPGQGYQVLIKNGIKRQLTLNCVGTTCTTPLRDNVLPELRGSELAHQSVTAHNASLLFYKHLLSNLPLDSKVKVYDSQGVLRGMETYNGKNLQVLIWGDDPHTTHKDGLMEQEKFQVLFVTNQGQEISLKELGLELPSYEYRTNDLIWAIKVQPKLFFPKAKVNLYPNPTQANTWLELELDYSGEVLVNVMDIQGRLIQPALKLQVNKGIYREQLNTNSLKPGVYMVQVTFKDQRLTHRLIIQ